MHKIFCTEASKTVYIYGQRFGVFWAATQGISRFRRWSG